MEIKNASPAGIGPGWFKTGGEDTPSTSHSSIGAAVQLGQVMRDERPGHIWRPRYGTMSAAAAIEQGILDEAAVQYIARQPGCHRQQLASVGTTNAGAVPKRGLAVYEGTPVGDVVKALQAYVSTRSADDALVFAKALDAALASREALE